MQPKQPKKALPSSGGNLPDLAKVRAMRLAQRETNHRIEELKLKLLHLTEQHMDKAVNLVREMIASDKKK